MRIVFINPNHDWNTAAHGYGARSLMRVRKIVPPLGIATLAALARHSHHVVIIDANALDLSHAAVVARVRALKPDLVGITSMYPFGDNVRRLARDLRPFTGMLVAGGADPTTLAEEYAADFDVVVRGQGELAFERLIDGTPKEEIAGLAFLRDGQLVDNGEGEMVADLDTLPMTPWDLLPLARYKPATMNIKYSYPSAAMMTSRGCPFRCSYCAVHSVAPRYQVRSLDHVFDEIRFLHRRRGVRHIEFFDDVFTIDRERVATLCERMLQEGLALRWCVVTSPNRVDRELLELMRRAGCYFILFGVQTTDPEELARVRRRMFADEVRVAVRTAQAAGIMVRLDFILGLPGATVASMNRSYEFVEEVAPDIVDFYPILSLAGSELGRDYTPPFSEKELLDLAFQFYRRFYGSPRYLRRALSHVESPVHLLRFGQCFWPLAVAYSARALDRLTRG